MIINKCVNLIFSFIIILYIPNVSIWLLRHHDVEYATGWHNGCQRRGNGQRDINSAIFTNKNAPFVLSVHQEGTFKIVFQNLNVNIKNPHVKINKKSKWVNIKIKQKRTCHLGCPSRKYIFNCYRKFKRQYINKIKTSQNSKYK